MKFEKYNPIIAEILLESNKNVFGFEFNLRGFHFASDMHEYIDKKAKIISVDLSNEIPFCKFQFRDGCCWDYPLHMVIDLFFPELRIYSEEITIEKEKLFNFMMAFSESILSRKLVDISEIEKLNLYDKNKEYFEKLLIQLKNE